MLRVLLLLIICSVHSFAQVDIGRFQSITQSVSSGSAAYGSGFQGKYTSNGKVVGDPYLDSIFVETNFQLINRAAKFKSPARYDILNNELEVKTTAGVKVLNSSLVESYTKYGNGDSTYYVSALKYKYEGTPLIGFLQVLSGGGIQLLKYVRIEVTKPTYNASLDVGDRNAYVIQKATLYYSQNGDLIKIKGKKEILQLFGVKKDQVSSFVESNKLDWKKEKDLAEIFKYYNQL
jgi:hypothetical protein